MKRSRRGSLSRLLFVWLFVCLFVCFGLKEYRLLASLYEDRTGQNDEVVESLYASIREYAMLIFCSFVGRST